MSTTNTLSTDRPVWILAGSGLPSNYTHAKGWLLHETSGGRWTVQLHPDNACVRGRSVRAYVHAKFLTHDNPFAK